MNDGNFKSLLALTTQTQKGRSLHVDDIRAVELMCVDVNEEEIALSDRDESKIDGVFS